MEVEQYMDIGLCQFHSIKIENDPKQFLHHKYKDARYGFLLSMSDRHTKSSISNSKEEAKHSWGTNSDGELLDSMVFICDSFKDFLLWRKALESYVVQKTQVTTIYTMEEALGKGSHAQVFLATPKYNDGSNTLKQSVQRY